MAIAVAKDIDGTRAARRALAVTRAIATVEIDEAIEELARRGIPQTVMLIEARGDDGPRVTSCDFDPMGWGGRVLRRWDNEYGSAGTLRRMEIEAEAAQIAARLLEALHGQCATQKERG